MAFNGYDKVFYKLLLHIAFRFVRNIYRLFQILYWTLNGTSSQLRESRKPENYNKCVHVMNYYMYFTFDTLKVVEKRDFILTHNRFESPRYIFDNDHVTLMTLEKEGAIFMEGPPGKHLWKSEYSSFIRLAQIEHGVRLLFVPMPAFLRMAEERGEPSETMVFLFNTARCGSTLFNQLMEMTDCCTSYSEPDCFNKLSQWQRQRGESDEMKALFRASIRWLCRPYKSFKPQAAVMKLAAPCIISIKFLYELYPKSKHLFMYRNIVPNAKSIYRLAQILPFLKLAFTLGKYHSYFVEACWNGLGFYGKDFRVKMTDDIDLAIYMYAVWCREYIRLRQSGFPASAIRYEDIMKDKEFAVRAILEYCDLSPELTSKALRGLELDSQRNSPLSRKILSQHKDPELTPGAIVRGDAWLKEMGLPLIHSDGLLEGTITYRS
jgi:hypothetical protein